MARWRLLPSQLFPPAAMRGSTRNLFPHLTFLDTIEQHAQRQEFWGEEGSCWSVLQPKSVARQGRSTTGLMGTGLRWSPTGSHCGKARSWP